MANGDRAREYAKGFVDTFRTELDEWIEEVAAHFQAGEDSARAEWELERARLLAIEAQAKTVLKAHDEWLKGRSG